MRLRLKFNIAIVTSFAVGLGATAWLLDDALRHNAADEVLEKARIMREAALAMRSYTSDDVAPLLQVLSTERFLPQTVPSFAAQANMRKVHASFPDFTYKEAALNPTNPGDRATDWEADIIDTFRNDPQRKELIVRRQTPTGESLELAFPIRITAQSCLGCHSTPAAAPASLRALYGDANGFGWQLGTTVGAQIVSVPMSVPLGRAHQAFVLIMGVLAGVFALIFVLLNLLLTFSVVRPVRRMTAIASEVSLGTLDAPEIDARGTGEIASLARAFNRMRRSLENAMRMLA